MEVSERKLVINPSLLGLGHPRLRYLERLLDLLAIVIIAYPITVFVACIGTPLQLPSTLYKSPKYSLAEAALQGISKD